MRQDGRREQTQNYETKRQTHLQQGQSARSKTVSMRLIRPYGASGQGVDRSVVILGDKEPALLATRERFETLNPCLPWGSFRIIDGCGLYE